MGTSVTRRGLTAQHRNKYKATTRPARPRPSPSFPSTSTSYSRPTTTSGCPGCMARGARAEGGALSAWWGKRGWAPRGGLLEVGPGKSQCWQRNSPPGLSLCVGPLSSVPLSPLRLLLPPFGLTPLSFSSLFPPSPKSLGVCVLRCDTQPFYRRCAGALQRCQGAVEGAGKPPSPSTT